MAKRSNRSGGGFFLDEEDVVEAPTEGAGLFRRPDLGAKFLRLSMRMIPVLVVLVAAAVFGLTASWLTADDEQVVREQPVSQHAGLAERAVADWLDQNSVPSTELVGWNYAVTIEDRDQILAQLEDEDQSIDPEDAAEVDTLEVHYLTLTSQAGGFYTASVAVAVNEAEGARLASGVSMIADDPVSMDQSLAEIGEGENSADVTEGMESAVDAWAVAYYSADPAELKLAVGDGRDGYGYMPMPAAEDVAVEVSSAVPTEDSEVDETTELPDEVYARVTVDVIWPEPEADGPEGSDDQSDEGDQSAPGDEEERAMSVDYDVLIADAETQAPTVTAWGPVGEYEQLDERVNAVEGREFAADSEDVGDFGDEDPAESGQGGDEDSSPGAEDDADDVSDSELSDGDEESDDE